MVAPIKVKPDTKRKLEELKKRFHVESMDDVIRRLIRRYEESREVRGTDNIELEINCRWLVKGEERAYCLRKGEFEVIPDLKICESCDFKVPEAKWDIDCPHLARVGEQYYCALRAPDLKPIPHPEICRKCGRRLDIALKMLRLEKKLPADIVKQIRLPPDEVFIVIRTCDYDLRVDKEGRLVLFCPESYQALILRTLIRCA